MPLVNIFSTPNIQTSNLTSHPLVMIEPIAKLMKMDGYIRVPMELILFGNFNPMSS